MNVNKIINKALNEASSIKDRGSYISPLMPGIREFEANINAPFIEYATEWDDPLLDYDSLDGKMSTKKSVARKLEKRADKIKKYMETHPDSFAWADEGGVLNSGPKQNNDAKEIKNYNPKKTTVSSTGLTKKKVNEANSDRYAGYYNGPLTMGEKDWGGSSLGPFTKNVSKFYNPELQYDSYDGSLDSHKKDRKKLETKSKRISLYNKKHPQANDEDGGIINQTPGKGKRIVPVNEWVELNKIPLNEDLAVWFGKKKKPKGSSQPKGPWVDICRKVDGKHPPCGRSDTSKGSYPKCRAAGVAGKMSDSQKRSACKQKRKAEKNDPQSGKGQKPVMTSYKPKKKRTQKESLEKVIKNILSSI